MLRKQMNRKTGAEGLHAAKKYAVPSDIYAELSINFQYDTRAGLKHAGGTQEGD